MYDNLSEVSGFWLGLMMRILVVVSLVLLFIGTFETVYSEVRQAAHLLNGETVQLKPYKELDLAQKKLADRIYHLIRKENEVPQRLSEQEVDRRFGIAKKDMLVGFANLNNDNHKDMIVMPGRTECGSGGCALQVFLAPNFQQISIEESSFLRLPVRVLPHKTNGLRDILINEKNTCIFNPHKSYYFCK